MRKLLPAVIVALLPLSGLAATSKVVLDVRNMTCSLCSVTVKKSLEQVPGVSQARIDFGNKTATITFDADKTTTAALTKATTDAGYPSTARK